jgi:prepilin-type N-terminal cleavage/methylation domain-containing protein/prepilin-type processing-associated H-X9-DG protein
MSALRNRRRRLSHRGNVCLGGFTLIELFVVIAIIAVLAALAFPLWGRMRASTLAATCTSNLRTLHQATMHFAQDNNGSFPVAKTPSVVETWIWKLVGAAPDSPGYLGVSGATALQRQNAFLSLSSRRAPFCLWCPAAEEAHPRPAGNHQTYAMNLSLGGTTIQWLGTSSYIPPKKIFQVTSPARTALFMDAGIRPNGAYGSWVGEAGLLPAPVHPPAIFKETGNPARSVNVVFVDGHVEMRRIGDIPTDFTDPFWDGTK